MSAATQRDDLCLLVAAAQGGDERAWAVLVDRLRPTVLAVARRHRLQEAECEDVAQQTWVRLWRNIRRIETPGAVGHWVATTARHEALRALGARRREVPTERLPEEVEDPDLDAALTARERREALHRALDGVSPRQRSVARMLIADPPVSYEEIGARLGIAPGAIGPTRNRCIARLCRDPHLARLADTPRQFDVRDRRPARS